MFRTILAIALSVPALTFAAGGISAPEPSETTKSCTDGKVWDKKTKSCVTASNSTLDDDTLYRAAREFAYAGQYAHAQSALSAMSNQEDDRVLTYWGFTHRKMGDLRAGMAFYQAALRKNPANILARSYMGQALVEQGDLAGARQQLDAIRAIAGRGGWPEDSLYQALLSGTTDDY